MINKERIENLTQEVWKGIIKLRGKFQAKNYPSVILRITGKNQVWEGELEKVN